jgi:hypothetical protein
MLVMDMPSQSFVFVFWDGSHYVAQAGLEFVISCLSFLSTGIIDVHHQDQPVNVFFKKKKKLEHLSMKP